MPIRFRDARLDDVAAMAALHNSTAGALTARFGEGPWSSLSSERGAELSLRHARVRVGTIDSRIVTMLRMAQKKPWSIDVSCFSPAQRVLYLTGMAVSVAHQGRGYGQMALRDALVVARESAAEAIRLDAYEGAGGAGGFYLKCGYAARGRRVYKGIPLLYFELWLAE
jgi:ribosomal protein S18 acetylase RimI-like enzyme